MFDNKYCYIVFAIWREWIRFGSLSLMLRCDCDVKQVKWLWSSACVPPWLFPRMQFEVVLTEFTLLQQSTLHSLSTYLAHPPAILAQPVQKMAMIARFCARLADRRMRKGRALGARIRIWKPLLQASSFERALPPFNIAPFLSDNLGTY